MRRVKIKKKVWIRIILTIEKKSIKSNRGRHKDR